MRVCSGEKIVHENPLRKRARTSFLGVKTNRYVYRTHNCSHTHGISSSSGAFFFFTNCQVPSPTVSIRLPPAVSICVVLGESFSKRPAHVCGQSSTPGITRALSSTRPPLPGPVNYYGSYILAARDKCRDPLFPGGPVRFLVSRKFGVSNLNNFAHRLPAPSPLPRDAR